MTDYAKFVASKLTRVPPTGMTEAPAMHASLFPLQRDLATWACRRGRAAIFAATGLGKTCVEVAYADAVVRHTGGSVLMLAPLAVAQQTIREAERLDVIVRYARHRDDLADDETGVFITNYDRLHLFDAGRFVGVVLDESSIIKNHTAKTLKALLEFARDLPWRLCATATPAPNDYTELGTHAEFLGICSQAEMLAEYFCHDGGETQTWRLKGHARKVFWAWVATWGALVRKPSDLGHDDGAYDLPPLHVHQHVIVADAETVRASGNLFAIEARTLTERRNAKRASQSARVAACVARIQQEPGERWVVWCELNAEQDALSAALGDDCVSVYGSLDSDEKERRLESFSSGAKRIIVTKPSIAGFGLNWQSAARMAFVGVTDSWEQYYQAVRREWRFGQVREVHVHVFSSEVEGRVVENLRRKEEDAERMAEELSAETRDSMRVEVRGSSRSSNEYAQRHIAVPSWITGAP